VWVKNRSSSEGAAQDLPEWAVCTVDSGRSDISLAVIHKRAKRPRRHTAERSELVNNCAAGHNRSGGRPALARSRSLPLYPKRVTERLPAEPVALALTSNRKPPQEGHYIGSMDSRVKRRNNQKKDYE
jgi:hypothetical protein